MEKQDLKKSLKFLYSPSAKAPEIVDVPPLNFLMVDGQGNPNTAHSYADALQALYSLSYTLKFMLKKGPSAIDYTVMPLEGLWWVPDMADFLTATKDEWYWTAMIMQPEWITAEHVEEARQQAARKNGVASLDLARFESFHECRAAQILYFGPYSGEGPTIARLHAYITEQGGRLRGKHHEIYLGDPRRTAPEKLKTIIRQPFE
jgi:hypothetical protein